jgi:Spy/CpxP family protein refolding chaperone
MSPRNRIAVLIAATSLSLGSLALAQSPGAGPGPGPGPMAGQRGMGMQPEAVNQRLAQVKDAMKLSPDQQNAWSTYEQAVKRAVDGRAKLHESMQASRGQADAMGDAHVAMMKFNAQSAEEINNARKALVAALSPEQKAKFEQLRGPGAMAGGGPGHGRGEGWHRGAGQGAGPCAAPATT